MSKQNYILVMCDDLGYGDLGFNGSKIIKTPNLDNLASEGAVLSNFYSGAPVCSPTRATCLTGRHCYRLGVFYANVGNLPKEEITIQQLMKQNGYKTGHFGKWHLGTLSKTIKDGRRGGEQNPELYSPPWERDFDECFSTEVAVPLYNPYENQPFVSKYWTGEGVCVEDNVSGDDSKVIMDRALPFIEKSVKEETPFFTVIWFHAPHAPVLASPEHRAMYKEFPENMQHYFGCVTAMDEQVGRLNAKLKELNIDDNTAIFFCSDNGPEGTGEHITLSCGSTGGLKGRKRSLFNGGINVPCIIKWNKYVEAGAKFNFLGSTLDYLPTILADSGIEYPDNRPVDGTNIIGLLKGEETKRIKSIPFRSMDSKEAMFGSPTFGLVNDDFKVLCNPNEDDSEDLMYNTFIDRREEYDVKCMHKEKFDAYKKEILEIAESFEKSHNGGDYKTENYKAVNEYIPNGDGWKVKKVK